MYILPILLLLLAGFVIGLAVANSYYHDSIATHRVTIDAETCHFCGRSWYLGDNDYVVYGDTAIGLDVPAFCNDTCRDIHEVHAQLEEVLLR